MALYFFLPEFKLHSYYFWIIVLLISSRYGLMAGVLSGVVCALVFSILLYLSIDKKALETFWDMKYLLEPFLFIFVGGFLGQLSQEKINKISETETQAQLFTQRVSTIETEFSTSEEARRELEKRIVGQLTTITTLYESAKKLESFKLSEIYFGTLDILSEHLGIEKCSIYILENRLLTLKARSEFGKLSEGEDKTLSKTEGLVGIAVETQKVVSIRDALSSLEFSKLKGGPLMAGPLLRKDGSLIGVITIEQIPFVRFTPYTIKIFSIILDWLSLSIENATYVQAVQSRNIQDEILGIYTYGYGKQRLKEEFLRSKKYSLPLSLLILRLKDFDQIDSKKLIPLFKSLYLILKNNLRDIDLISQYESKDSLAVILPTLQGAELQKIKLKVIQDIDSYAFRPYEASDKLLESEILEASFKPAMQSETDLIQDLGAAPA
ncbi:MAG: GAF domain-containing protein [Deltaproteobacteria bacterium]|nr:GAF domain-containing protein [Deltaproteobacteria bacterium]